MGRAPCCDKANVTRGPWSSEEDAKLKSYIDKHGTGGNWIALPQKIGLKRCGKSCRLRWLNYLRPNIKHGGFSEEEDDIICGLYITIGSRWSIIAGQLPGRTDNDIKNYWNTRLKKRLMGKQRRDHHQQHRRSRGVNQEAKRVENQESGGGGRSSTYWSSWQPVHPSSQADPRAAADDEEQASIRKLLIKLGGGFSIDDGVRNPTPLAVDSPVLYRDSSDLMAVGVGVGMQDPTGFPTSEIGEMLNCSPVKLEGLDCFYGEGMTMADESNMVSTSEGANWREVMSPPAYPPMVPSYQGMHQLLFGDRSSAAWHAVNW